MLCSGFPSQLALTGLIGLAGIAPQTSQGGLSLRFVALVSAADTVVLLGAIAWLLARRGESPRTLFLGPRDTDREVGLGLLLAPAVLVFISSGIALLRAVVPALRTVPDNPLEALATTPEGAITMTLVALVAGGVREEVQRAFLLHRFRTDLGGARRGLLLTSLVFGLGHVVQGWDAVIVTAALGAFWGALYLARASIAAAVVSHGLANAAQIVIAYAQRGA